MRFAFVYEVVNFYFIGSRRVLPQAAHEGSMVQTHLKSRCVRPKVLVQNASQIKMCAPNGTHLNRGRGGGVTQDVGCPPVAVHRWKGEEVGVVASELGRTTCTH